MSETQSVTEQRRTNGHADPLPKKRKQRAKKTATRTQRAPRIVARTAPAPRVMPTKPRATPKPRADKDAVALAQSFLKFRRSFVRMLIAGVDTACEAMAKAA